MGCLYFCILQFTLNTWYNRSYHLITSIFGWYLLENWALTFLRVFFSVFFIIHFSLYVFPVFWFYSLDGPAYLFPHHFLFDTFLVFISVWNWDLQILKQMTYQCATLLPIFKVFFQPVDFAMMSRILKFAKICLLATFAKSILCRVLH